MSPISEKPAIRTRDMTQEVNVFIVETAASKEGPWTPTNKRGYKVARNAHRAGEVASKASRDAGIPQFVQVRRRSSPRALYAWDKSGNSTPLRPVAGR